MDATTEFDLREYKRLLAALDNAMSVYDIDRCKVIARQLDAYEDSMKRAGTLEAVELHLARERDAREIDNV